MKNKTCIFTIVSNNYLHYANTLFESVAKYCPDADLYLGLCDKKTEDTRCDLATVIEMTDLDIPDISRFIYQYSILELNTAIKPYVIEQLMDKGYDTVIYFDPDIKLYDTIEPMLELLTKHNVLLTPHLTNLLDDGKLPDELGILQAGSYNLGYIGLRTCDETRKLVKWWQSKLYKECVVDISRGLFVDQKWMDMVPSMFEGVYICRDEGWNVAYWNLNHRDIVKVGEEQFEVNGRPLMFFHYSGYSITAKTLSKHQTRFDKTSKGPALVELCEIYNEALKRNGIDHFQSLAYAYNRFSDGVKVPDAARRIIRDDAFFDSIDFFAPEQMTSVYDYLNSPSKAAEDSPILISRLAERLWRQREDLQVTFPDIFVSDSTQFAGWVLHAAEKEAGFSEEYLTPIRRSLTTATVRNRSPQVAGPQRSSLQQKLFRTFWDNRTLLPLPLRLKLGKSVANWAFQKAFESNNIGSIYELNYGVNLIGYMNAESGVGEAGRASYRGLVSAEVPHVVMDYRVGNFSRMEEKIDCEFSLRPEYDVNLIHVNADQSRVVRDSLGEQVFRDRYNIGYWYWEMPEFPDFWDFAFEQVDEIWVATQYTHAAISQKTDKPVYLIPPNVKVEAPNARTRAEFDLNDEEFVFFHMSDVLSMPDRKNPIDVVRAFKLAFDKHPAKPVRLLLKISNLEHQPELADEIYSAAENDQRISLIKGYLDREQLNSLMGSIDAYVSLHRAEGFGLPIAEAMAHGKVAIATYWSGNVDFMTAENSLPVSYELVELQEDVGPYQTGQVWANPDINDAAEKMFFVAQDEGLVKTLSEQAKKTIEEGFSANATGAAIRSRLQELCGN